MVLRYEVLCPFKFYSHFIAPFVLIGFMRWRFKIISASSLMPLLRNSCKYLMYDYLCNTQSLTWSKPVLGLGVESQICGIVGGV